MVASQVAERTVSRPLPDLAPSQPEGREEHSSSAGHVLSHDSGMTGPRRGPGRGDGVCGGGRGDLFVWEGDMVER